MVVVARPSLEYRVIQPRNLVVALWDGLSKKQNPSPAVIAMGFADAQPILQFLAAESCDCVRTLASSACRETIADLRLRRQRNRVGCYLECTCRSKDADCLWRSP